MSNVKPLTPNFDRINPALCINGKLRKLHRMINQAYQRKINAFGLQGSMLSILFIIGKKECIHQKELCEMLVLEQSTMSRDVKRLKEKRLVKTVAGADARQKQLMLTHEGFALIEEISPVWEHLHHKVDQLLGDFNVKHIDVLIQAVKTNLEDLKA